MSVTAYECDRSRPATAAKWIACLSAGEPEPFVNFTLVQGIKYPPITHREVVGCERRIMRDKKKKGQKEGKQMLKYENVCKKIKARRVHEKYRWMCRGSVIFAGGKGGGRE